MNARNVILPDAETVLALPQKWFDDYDEIHSHSGLRFLPPREFKMTSQKINFSLLRSICFVERNLSHLDIDSRI